VVLPPWWWWRRGTTGSTGGREAEGGQQGGVSRANMEVVVVEVDSGGSGVGVLQLIVLVHRA
jgi:hypothetical protein